MTGVLIRDRREGREKRRCPGKREVGVRVMLSQAKECLEPPEARESKEGFSPQSL